MEILTSINRPLNIWGKDALWLKHSSKSQETKHKSKALLPLPFRTGKKRTSPSIIYFGSHNWPTFYQHFKSPNSMFPVLSLRSPSPDTEWVCTNTHGCHIQHKQGNENDWREQASRQRQEKESTSQSGSNANGKSSLQLATSTLYQAIPS